MGMLTGVGMGSMMGGVGGEDHSMGSGGAGKKAVHVKVRSRGVSRVIGDSSHLGGVARRIKSRRTVSLERDKIGGSCGVILS